MIRMIMLGMFTFLSFTTAHAATFEKVIIQSGKSKHKFMVEVADDEAKRSRGLMFRESLDKGKGMLFVFRREQIENFWMKNTLIPLDLIFIGIDGKIRKVHSNAKPHDRTLISSESPVIAVLEIKGGEASRRGIKAGDSVISPVFRVK